MRILIAPDSFKESLTARQACQAIARGIAAVDSRIELDLLPLADGGEGTVEAMITAAAGSLEQMTVHGPLNEPVTAEWGLITTDHRTAVIEMASASGLAMVPPGQRNPLHTTTFGTGELLRAAVESQVDEIIIGIGGSATNDGGTGAAQAIGIQFFDAAGQLCQTPMTGGQLASIARIDIAKRLPRVPETRIRVACDVQNPLCGPRGASAVYGPQKGATPDVVEQLDRDLEHLAEIMKRDLSVDVRDIPGSGAAGGLGAGLIAFCGATLEPGAALIMDTLKLDERIALADLVITGEGRLDGQSMMGKLVGEIGKRAQKADVPIVALVGGVGEHAEDTLQILDSYHCATARDVPSAVAFARAPEFLEKAAEQFARDHLHQYTK